MESIAFVGKRIFEVIEGKTTTVKITVAKDRISVKFPDGFPKDKKLDIGNMAVEIARKINTEENTFRGVFRDRNMQEGRYVISMSNSNRSQWKHFGFEKGVLNEGSLRTRDEIIK
jgi:hypothetical protein